MPAGKAIGTEWRVINMYGDDGETGAMVKKKKIKLNNSKLSGKEREKEYGVREERSPLRHVRDQIYYLYYY